MKILSAQQMQVLDNYTIAHEPITAIDLMERAAKVFTEALLACIEPGTEVVVFCGKGNNGGDGLAIARILHHHHYAVQVYVLEMSAMSSPCFDLNLERLKGLVEIQHLLHEADLPELNHKQVVVDAIFGSGLKGKVHGFAAGIIKRINNSGAKVYSVDVPSGLDGGLQPELPEVAVKATAVFTFHAPKLAFLLPEFAAYVPRFKVLDIGLSVAGSATLDSVNEYVDSNWLKGRLHTAGKFAHKGTNGHALVAAGSYGKSGAAVLAVRAALRSGAGLVTACVPQCAYTILQSTNPEAMVLVAGEHELQPVVLPMSYTAIALGPGIGQSDSALQFLQAVLNNTPVPLVLDADALNLLSQHRHLLHALPEGTILTPHPGEFKRLAGEWNSEVMLLQLLRGFAARYKVIVVLKGAHTATATPDGRVYFNSTGNPGMAKGGSGDALTGVIVALRAQSYTALEAAVVGVYVHGLAGDLACREMGDISLLSSDLVSTLPKAFQLLAQETITATKTD